MKQRYREHSYEQKEQQPMIHNLIKQLLKVWSTKKVEDKYQNYFLIFLDTLSKSEAEKAIAKEIRLTLENKSHFFRISKAMAAHLSILQKIRKSLDEIKNVEDSSLIDLKHFALLLNELRNSNFEVADEVLNFNYECLETGRHEFELIKGNNYLFEQLNADNGIIKSSFLEQYITFSTSYDPFFLHHYESNKKVESQKRQNSSIHELFSLSISKAYKFMRAQQEILEFLSGRIPNKLLHGKVKRLHYQLIDEKPLKEDDQVSKSNFFQLGNNIYMNRNGKERDEPENDFLQRSKTQESPMGKFMANSKYSRDAGANLSYNYKKYRLPKLENIRKTTQSDFIYSKLYGKNMSGRKFSQEDSTQKYTFKVRRMSVKGSGKEPLSPVLSSKATNQYISSINKIQEKQEQFQNFSLYRSDNSNYFKSKEIKQQFDEELDIAREEPLSYKYPSQSPILKVHPITVEKAIETTPVTYKNFKLKAGNLKISNVAIFLKELNIKQSYKRIFEESKLENSLKITQYYLHKFYINEKLQAVSLCCAIPQGNIVIKYWAPLQSCDKQMSHFLFKKYIEHIEKNSASNQIYYNAFEVISQVLNNGFIVYQQRTYIRHRAIPSEIDNFSYSPFLTLNFSIIAIPKTIGKDLLGDIVIPSNKYVPFNEKEFVCFNYLLIASKIMNLSGGFSSFGTYTSNIKNFKDISTKLIKQEMFQTPYNTKLNIPSTNLTTIKIKNVLFSAYFIANNPYLKCFGHEVYDDEESLIVSLKLFQNNMNLYFGKGFTSISSMISVMKNRKSNPQKIEFCLRMFSKRMRGRILSINLRDEYCFGDFEIVFEWIDFLRGKIEHNLNEYELFGGQSFYCIVEIENENILGFEVKAENFL